MILTFTIASNEVEDFAMKIHIEADATFEDLHRTIQEACGYMDFGVHRFYVCDEDWCPEHRIFQTDKGVSSDVDVYLMDETPLEDFLEDEGQRLAYRFDPESKRLLLMEVSATTFGKSLPEPIVKKHGEPPMQMLIEEEPAPQITTPNATDEELEESFYGDDGFEEGELDEEGFDVVEQ